MGIPSKRQDKHFKQMMKRRYYGLVLIMSASRLDWGCRSPEKNGICHANKAGGPADSFNIPSSLSSTSLSNCCGVSITRLTLLGRLTASNVAPKQQSSISLRSVYESFGIGDGATLGFTRSDCYGDDLAIQKLSVLQLSVTVVSVSALRLSRRSLKRPRSLRPSSSDRIPPLPMLGACL